MRAFLRSSFEPGELPACMPTYYMSAIKNWSSLPECQRLWYNKELKIGSNTAYNNNLFSIGMWYVGDCLKGEMLFHLIHGGGVVPERLIG